MLNVTLRRELPDDFQEVEQLTRRAFWNIHEPGCNEHYLAHILRQHPDFVPTLDFVAEADDGTLIGNIMYTKATLTDSAGHEASILTFGPLSVAPAYQRQGVGKALMTKTFAAAAALGFPAVVIYGNPENYVSSGFKSCLTCQVCLEDGTFPAAMLVKELKPHFFDGTRWVYHESPAYHFDPSDAETFDRQFEPMEKKICPSQEAFFIYSHAILIDS